MKPDGSSGSVQARFTVRTAVESTVVASKSKDIRNGQIAANEKSTRGVAALGRGSATDTRALAKMVKLSRHLEGPGGTLEKEIGAKGEAAKNVARDRKKKPAENAVLVLEFSLAARGSQTTQVTQETESGAEKQSRGTIEKKGGAARREPKLTVADMRSARSEGGRKPPRPKPPRPKRRRTRRRHPRTCRAIPIRDTLRTRERRSEIFCRATARTPPRRTVSARSRPQRMRKDRTSKVCLRSNFTTAGMAKSSRARTSCSRTGTADSYDCG